MTRKRHIPPSRVRYEEKNPTVSCRVSRLLYNRLKVLRAQGNNSLGDMLREALEAQHPETDRAFLKGYHEGHDDAEKIYRLYYQCSVCNAPLALDDEPGKRSAARYMTQNGWGHKTCHDLWS